MLGEVFTSAIVAGVTGLLKAWFVDDEDPDWITWAFIGYGLIIGLVCVIHWLFTGENLW